MGIVLGRGIDNVLTDNHLTGVPIRVGRSKGFNCFSAFDRHRFVLLLIDHLFFIHRKCAALALTAHCRMFTVNGL
jgi:hypothetical protein